MLPNDEGEQERMEMHYHNLRLVLHDRIFLAPIEAPTGILDVGTGTGTWAMDVADAHPQADVVGFDLSPIQPTYVPPNLQFEVLDAEESWGYAANRFDLIHTRFMNGISLKSWPHFYAEAMTCLKPGGWVENQEFDLQYVCDDNSIPENSKMQEWVELWNRGAEMGGFTGRCYPHRMAQHMREAGLVNVEVKNFMMPVGPWPRDRSLNEAGTYGLVAMHDGLHGLSVKVFTNFLGWTIEDLEVFLTAAKAEMMNRSIHAYWPAVSAETSRLSMCLLTLCASILY